MLEFTVRPVQIMIMILILILMSQYTPAGVPPEVVARHQRDMAMLHMEIERAKTAAELETIQATLKTLRPPGEQGREGREGGGGRRWRGKHQPCLCIGTEGRELGGF